MKSLVLVKTATTALRINVLRSFLTMLGVIIGVAAVIVMVAMGNGTQQQIDNQIKSLGGNVIFISGDLRAAAGARNSQVMSLASTDAELIEKQVPGIEAAAPILSTSGQVIVGNLNWSTQIYGINNNYFEVRDWSIKTGNFFNANEQSRASKVAIIGATVKQELFGNSEAVGQVMRIDKFNVQIIGVLDSKGQDIRGNDQDDVIFLPIETVRTKITGRTGDNPHFVNFIQVSAFDGEDLAVIEYDIEQLLRQRHRTPVESNLPFRIRNVSEMIETRSETTRAFNTLLTAVASVSLVVGGIGIMNIMLVSVTERTREIGLRMAIGAKRSDILNQFLIEAMTLSFIGGVLGIFVSYGLTASLNYFDSDFLAIIDVSIVLISLGFSVATGIVFGYYPALKASRQTPIESLRFE